MVLNRTVVAALLQLSKREDFETSNPIPFDVDLINEIMGVLQSQKAGLVEMEQWLQKMKQLQLQPNLQTYYYLLNAAGLENKHAKMFTYMEMMKFDGFTPSARVYDIIISSYAQAGNLKSMIEWYKVMSAKHHVSPLLLDRIINAFEKAKDLEGMISFYETHTRKQALHKEKRSLKQKMYESVQK